MRRFWLLTFALVVALGLAMALTTRTALGIPLWHLTAGFVGTLILAAGAWRLLQHRRTTTLLMAFTGTAAVATGFVMLYTRQFPFKEWITWWHSITSFALMLAFLVHWLHNHARLAGFTKRLLTSERRAGFAAAGGWALLLVLGAFTWAPGWRERFTGDRYLALASWAILVGVSFSYGLWLLFRLPALQARLQQARARNVARALVDTGLWLAHWLAIVTGFALVYLGEALRAGPWKYVSKWWHTVTSVAFLALVVLHIGFNARLLAAHARRLDGDLSGAP